VRGRMATAFAMVSRRRLQVRVGAVKTSSRTGPPW